MGNVFNMLNSEPVLGEVLFSDFVPKFWEYNATLGRRWNLDPVDQISISNYATFCDNPILYSDHLGNTANKYDVNESTGEVKKTGDEGGDKTDYVHVHSDPQSHYPESSAVYRPRLPAEDYEIPVQVTHLPGTGFNPFVAYRGPGKKVMGSLIEGCTPSDDPLTSMGPGLLYGLGRRAVLYTAEKVVARIGVEAAAEGGGSFYRAMSNAEYGALESSGGLTHMPGKELFVSSEAAYSRAYLQKSGYDVLVKFDMKPGAMNYFNQVGVMHRTAAGASGWAGRGSLLWKSEQGVMNLGIQQNTHMFNPWIQSFKPIP